MIETLKNHIISIIFVVSSEIRGFTYTPNKNYGKFEIFLCSAYFIEQKKPLIFLKKWYIPMYLFICVKHMRKTKTKLFFQLNFLQEMSS